MQTELDAFINENAYCIPIRDEYGDTHYEATVIDVDDLRAWMAGKVLCDANPAAWMDETGDIVPHSVYMDGGMTGRTPLYKAAGAAYP